MSSKAITISIFTLRKKKEKKAHLEIVERRSQLAAMLNICLKPCSRPPEKAPWFAFHGINPETVINVDSSEMSQTIYELLRLTNKDYEIKREK